MQMMSSQLVNQPDCINSFTVTACATLVIRMLTEGPDGVNRQPSNGLKINRQLSNKKQICRQPSWNPVRQMCQICSVKG